MRRVTAWVMVMLLVVVVVPLLMVRCAGGPAQEKKPVPMDTIRVYHHLTGQVAEEPMDEYLTCVTAAEMPAAFEAEALKSQAVAARTYAVVKRLAAQENPDPNGAHKGADVCTDFNCSQAYTTKEDALAKWGADGEKNWNKIAEAVRSTHSEVVTFQGQPIRAVFHSSSSGKTENSRDVWGGDFPYLTSVDSPGEEACPYHTSTVTVPVDDWKAKLSAAAEGIAFDDANLFGDFVRSDAGGVLTVTMGDHVFKGTEIRSIFGLRSACFDAAYQDGNIVFFVTGNGHGVGMSQYGANAMAQQGADYQTILTHYYTGTVVEKVG